MKPSQMKPVERCVCHCRVFDPAMEISFACSVWLEVNINIPVWLFAVFGCLVYHVCSFFSHDRNDYCIFSFDWIISSRQLPIGCDFDDATRLWLLSNGFNVYWTFINRCALGVPARPPADAPTIKNPKFSQCVWLVMRSRSSSNNNQ